MAGMNLFIDEPRLSFETEKRASAQLDEDPSAWPRQILVELYRSVPESSDYSPQVMFIKTDREQGFGIGVIVITATTDSALAVTRVGPSAKKALIPVVVKSHVLAPLDLLMRANGKMTPLTAARLREALFRPETFEMITEDWGDTSLYNLFYPPGRSDNTFGAGISQGPDGGTAGAVTFVQGPGMKMASVRFEMLEDLVGTVMGRDIERVAKALEVEPGLLKAAATNSVFLNGLSIISSAEANALGGSAALMKVALDQAIPSVVQMGYSDALGSYWVKIASRDAYCDNGAIEMDRNAFLKFAGEEVSKKVDTEGTVTVSATPAVTTGADATASKWKTVEEPGIYKVKTIHGKEMMGWVLPNLLDLDGTRIPMVVFTNGSSAMVQDSIVGARVATGVDLPAATPKGSGVFYVSGQGGIEATAPLVVEGGEAEMAGGNSWLVRSVTGEKSKVRVVPGIEKMEVRGGEFFLPKSAKFLPLQDEQMIPLVGSVDELSKTSSAILAPSIEIYGGDGSEFGFHYNNVPGLAAEFDNILDTDTAMMALCLAGLNAKTAHTKLAQASTGSNIKISGVVDIRRAVDLIAESRKIAQTKVADISAMRRYLVKEAATLPNVMTVDSVLSLGFINPENVRMFISRIPYLEQALSMVCELVLGSRVGLTEIPEAAASRCARALDDVVWGLRALGLRDTKEAD